MDFKEKVKQYLSQGGIYVKQIEQEGATESIVCHISKDANEKVKQIKEVMEKDLDVQVMLSNDFGMNVVIVESNNLE